METVYHVLCAVLILATLVPFLPHQHWLVRGFDFAKIQIVVLQLTLLAAAPFLLPPSPKLWVWQTSLLSCALYNLYILARFTRWWPVLPVEVVEEHSDDVTLLSANVLQFNTQYDRFLKQVRDTDPDIVLTMESNEDWETALKPLESDYPYLCKIPLENTYGMHLYSKLPMTSEVHYFVADDLPSIEARIQTRKGYRFVLFGVHPPPPSPTEEPNSKERDGELLSVAKKIRQDKKTTVVIGDFNNVAWARSSELFRKTSETIDPRIGRAMCCTFHARYRFLRIPIDQIYHTPDVFVQEIFPLPDFGSDHFALFCRFFINRHDDSQEERVEHLEAGEMAEVNEMIQDGIEEESDREEVVTEE